MRLAGLAAGRLDNVRVNRTLREPLDAFEPVRLLIEDRDKFAADNLAFVFRDPNAFEGRSRNAARH